MKKLLFRFLALLLGTAIGLLLAEGAVRLFMPDPGAVKAVSDLRPGERFLQPGVLPLAKAGQTRIAFVGDSYVYGQGVEFGELFSQQAGERLRRHWPGRTIEILNFGRPGANTIDELDILKRHALPYDPDLVVLGFVLNDFTSGKATRDFARIYQAEKSKYLLFKRCEGFSRLAYFLDWTVFQLFSDMNRIHVEYLSGLYDPGRNPKYAEAAAALDEILTLMAPRRGVVLLFPMFVKGEANLPFYRAASRLLRRSCQKHNVAFIELLPHFQDQAPSSWWASLEDHHPNARAHARVADVLSAWMIREKLL